jgi:tRNA-dihydrouridine synthase A
MMDWTDRHDRVFLRQFSRHALLYTEMITSAALIHGDANYLLHHDPSEQPVAIQLGGSEPDDLAQAAELAAAAGYCEINLNVGCPSERVKSGAFGACLMADPPLVARCVSAMRRAVSIPVTVKCRTGIDDRDSEQELADFVAQVAEAGCDVFIIHARKALLDGLSPKQNREIPELNYGRVFKIKALFPALEIVLNGGISTLDSAEELFSKVDGIMLGRAAYQNPYLLHEVDSRIFGDVQSSKSRLDYLNQYLVYIENELQRGTPLHHMTRHILGLFKGQAGGKQFRRHLSENSHRKDASLNLVLDAMAYVSQAYPNNNMVKQEK